MRASSALICMLVASPAAAQSLTVLSSNATKALIEELGPQFEKASGHTLTLKFICHWFTDFTFTVVVCIIP